MALGLIEQVFGGLEQAELPAQQDLLGQPGPLLNAEDGDQAGSTAHDFGGLAPASAMTNGQWDDCLTQLAQTALHTRGGLLEHAALGSKATIWPAWKRFSPMKQLTKIKRLNR